jgi:RAP1 GTPase activating protein 1
MAATATEIVSPAPGYRLEGAGGEEDFEVGLDGPIIDEVFDLGDTDYRFFREHFVDGDQTPRTFLAADSPLGPLAISMVRKGDQYRALVRSREGNTRLSVMHGEVRTTFMRRVFGMGPTGADVLRSMDPRLPTNRLKSVTDPRLNTALLNLEEKQTIKGFKFGILYACEGQSKEDEMFANQAGSPAFEQFLDFLAERVPLQDWENFRGGLDVRTGTTGELGLYTQYNNNEIMYHVSTMLPFNPKDKQQLERKRHIGNDIVVIVWQEGDTVYRPSTISSRQVHVVLLVKEYKNPEDPSNRYYRIAVISRDGVPEFGPPIPNVAVFKEGPEFRELFFSKSEC